jgi:hypothetical protein
MYLQVSLLMMVVVAGMVSVLQTYWLLNRGYYRWQWRAFMTGFFVAYYVQAVQMGWYLYANQTPAHAPLVIFTLSALCISGLIGLIAGMSSYLASFLFVQ